MFPFSFVSVQNVVSVRFRKNLKNRHCVVSGLKTLKLSTNTCFGVSFQKNVFSSLLLFLSVCYQNEVSDSERNEIASLSARNFNNRWLLHVKLSEPINLCQNIWLIENVSRFYFWNKRRQKGQNFQFFRGQFLRNAWPYGYDFWRVFRDLCEASNKYIFTVFSRYSKS